MRELYAELSDTEIAWMALSQGSQLRPEAVAVLHAEIRKRGLSSELGLALTTQADPISPGELQDLADRFRRQPCGRCGSWKRPLNAFGIARVWSVILVTSYKKELLIACPDCILASAKRAQAFTPLVGWWGIPWGPIRTIQAIAINFRTIRHGDEDHPSEALTTFVRDHRGEITVALRDAEAESRSSDRERPAF